MDKVAIRPADSQTQITTSMMVNPTTAAEVAQDIPAARPRRVFEGHRDRIAAAAVFPDGGRMVTGSYDKTLRLWNLKDGTVFKQMEGHRGKVEAVAVSGDGKFIASGDDDGELITWDGHTGEHLTQAIKAHSRRFTSMEFSPDSAVLVTASDDQTAKFWRTDTWDVQGNPINAGQDIKCIRYSPSGEYLALPTWRDIQICTGSGSNETIAKFRADGLPFWAYTISVAWMPDGSRLLSGGSTLDPTIREWDTSTWNQVGDPWSGHTGAIFALAINSAGTLVVSASVDRHARLWRLSDRQTIAIFNHSSDVYYANFSTYGDYIITGGQDCKITEWVAPGSILLEAVPEELMTDELLSLDSLQEQETNDARNAHSKILSMSAIVHSACITNDLSTAQELLTLQINTDGNDYNAYANRSLIHARKCDWDSALDDAFKSISIQSSLIGYISKGIALCGKMEFKKATRAFDIAFMFTEQTSNIIHIIFLIKAIILFNTNQQDEAIQRIQELTSACPIADTLTCRMVEAYLHVQLGINAFNGSRHDQAADHFATAINSGALSDDQVIDPKYEIFVILFGWDFASLWTTTNRNRCQALLQAGRLVQAYEAYKYMTHVGYEVLKVELDWSTTFKKECCMLCVASGDAALAASVYDKAIELFSAAIDLNSATDTIFAKRCRARLGRMLWEAALDDAQKVIELNPSSHVGYDLKHTALRGAQRYDEAIKAFECMLSKLDESCDAEMQALRRQYISPSEAHGKIQKAIDAQMEDTPPRLLDTNTGRLCDRDGQINTFKTGPIYNELLSFPMKDSRRRMQHIQDTVETFFACVMLSHRWEGKEPLLLDIRDEDIYKLDPVGSKVKLQLFCKVARDAGFRWAWIDTCCIDQNNNVELQRSVNSMFSWYRHSALTIIFLSDVPPSSKPGAMAMSAWNTRGWTVQEFLAPKTVLFYQNDWSLYLDDHSPNHKESVGIMRELEDATGINGRALIAFRPGMSGAREKLQWASKRVTTWPEDIAYSLFGIFGIHLPVLYGEKKQSALGRLLQEIIAQSGDVSCLDWVGKSSEFNSFLPADIASYANPPFMLQSLSEDSIRHLISSLRNPSVIKSAYELYTTLDQLSAPRFANRRLHLHCIALTVTEVTSRPDSQQGAYFTYAVKANGLRDLSITTEDELISVSRMMPIRQAFLLVRPWDRDLLQLYDSADSSNFVDEVGSIGSDDYLTPPSSPLHDSGDMNPVEDVPMDSESDLALRLIVRLGQPFRAFLLAQQRGGEYKRVAADHDIIAKVGDTASICDVMEVRTLEIL